MRMKTIQYAIDTEINMVFSRVDDRVYYPVLDFEAMTPANGFKTVYNYEEMSVFALVGYSQCIWTRKIPNKTKNIHRKYWGFKPLKGKNRWES